MIGREGGSSLGTLGPPDRTHGAATDVGCLEFSPGVLFVWERRPPRLGTRHHSRLRALRGGAGARGTSGRIAGANRPSLPNDPARKFFIGGRAARGTGHSLAINRCRFLRPRARRIRHVFLARAGPPPSLAPAVSQTARTHHARVAEIEIPEGGTPRAHAETELPAPQARDNRKP
jgi:hypothetical protein